MAQEAEEEAAHCGKTLRAGSGCGRLELLGHSMVKMDQNRLGCPVQKSLAALSAVAIPIKLVKIKGKAFSNYEPYRLFHLMENPCL